MKKNKGQSTFCVSLSAASVRPGTSLNVTNLTYFYLFFFLLLFENLNFIIKKLELITKLCFFLSEVKNKKKVE